MALSRITGTIVMCGGIDRRETVRPAVIWNTTFSTQGERTDPNEVFADYGVIVPEIPLRDESGYERPLEAQPGTAPALAGPR